MKKLYIIAGCNGAGKTTASFNILPNLLDCKEFVNADEIARGISPFQPEKVSIEAGRIMLHRIHELLEDGVDFSFETTLATRSFTNTIKYAKSKGYFITLVYFWLESPELAKTRVSRRIQEGGHSIEPAVIERRYFSGIRNLFSLYFDLVDAVMIFDNSKIDATFICERQPGENLTVFDQEKYNALKSMIS